MPRLCLPFYVILISQERWDSSLFRLDDCENVFLPPLISNLIPPWFSTNKERLSWCVLCSVWPSFRCHQLTLAKNKFIPASCALCIKIINEGPCALVLSLTHSVTKSGSKICIFLTKEELHYILCASKLKMQRCGSRVHLCNNIQHPVYVCMQMYICVHTITGWPRAATLCGRVAQGGPAAAAVAAACQHHSPLLWETYIPTPSIISTSSNCIQIRTLPTSREESCLEFLITKDPPGLCAARSSSYVCVE